MDFLDSKINIENKIVKLNAEIGKLKSNIQLLKIKILSILNMNNLYSYYLIKIINRYLSDILIRKLIKQYPNKFAKISISHKNFYDILTNFNDILFKNNDDAILNDLKNKLNINNLIFALSEKEKKLKLINLLIILKMIIQ